VSHDPIFAPGTPPRRRRRAQVWRSALAAALALLSVLALASSASALEQKISFSGNDSLGFSVAVQGDTLVIGTLQPNDIGVAYVYQRAGDSWEQTAKLTASDTTSGDLFGASVAIDGDTIMVGAPAATIGKNASQGAVYTFSRTGAAVRTETAKLTASDGAPFDELGASLAIDGDTIVAGSPGATVGTNTHQGALYTFNRDGAPARTETAKLTASDGVSGAQLGASVAIDGDTIVAGAPSATVGANVQGAAYTFARTGATARTETAKLNASHGQAGDLLGWSVAINGDTIAAGAPAATFGGLAKGAVYTFTRAGGVARTETATLSASDGSDKANLGFTVAIDADTILAGAPTQTIGSNLRQGAAYTFARSGAQARRQTGELSDADGAASDLFGLSVALDAGTTVIGAPVRGEVSVFFSPAPLPPAPAPPSPAASPPPPPAASPVLSKLAVNPTTIHRNSRHSHLKASPKGAIVFTLSTAATVKLTFAEILPGRRDGTTCGKPARSNHAGRRCTRTVIVGGLTVRGKAGKNTLALAASLSRGRALRIGRYRLTATPTSASGDTGTARTTTFRLVR
jgi:hypothetical protein